MSVVNQAQPGHAIRKKERKPLAVHNIAPVAIVTGATSIIGTERSFKEILRKFGHIHSFHDFRFYSKYRIDFEVFNWHC